MKKQDRWVIYICNGCGAAVAGGETKHGETCNGRKGFEEVVVVRQSKKQGPVKAHRPNPFGERLGK